MDSIICKKESLLDHKRNFILEEKRYEDITNIKKSFGLSEKQKNTIVPELFDNYRDSHIN